MIQKTVGNALRSFYVYAAVRPYKPRGGVFTFPIYESRYDASVAACGVITGAEQTGVCLSKLDVHETILIGPGCAPCLLRVHAPVSPGCRPLRPRAARVCSRVCAPLHQIKRGIGGVRKNIRVVLILRIYYIEHPRTSRLKVRS